MNMIRSSCEWIDRFNFLGACLAAGACAMLSMLLLVEVVAASFLAWSQPWAVEYASYLCAFVLLSGSGYALRFGAHIRVAMVLNHLPLRVARALDVLCTLCALYISGLLTVGLIEQAWRSHVRHTVSYFVMQTPMWIPQAFVALGAFMLSLALLARLLRWVIGDAPDLADDREIGQGVAE
jgi:TRAP-type C4-dicarboxylate transport system permease small subunit